MGKIEIKSIDLAKDATIHFKNGSTIEAIEPVGESVRSKRGEKQIEQMKNYYRKLWLLLGDVYDNLYW